MTIPTNTRRRDGSLLARELHVWPTQGNPCNLQPDKEMIVHRFNDEMTKQQKYSIVMDMQNHYRVVLRADGTAVYESINSGKAGLEDCQDWLAKQPEEE